MSNNKTNATKTTTNTTTNTNTTTTTNTNKGPKWKGIYPIYINSKKTLAEGRRLPSSKCQDNPTTGEIAEACRQLGYDVIVEPDKAYSRDFTQKGRIKVLFLLENGDFAVDDIKTKPILLTRISALIPKLRSRTGSGGGGDGKGQSNAKQKGRKGRR